MDDIELTQEDFSYYINLNDTDKITYLMMLLVDPDYVNETEPDVSEHKFDSNGMRLFDDAIIRIEGATKEIVTNQANILMYSGFLLDKEESIVGDSFANLYKIIGIAPPISTN